MGTPVLENEPHAEDIGENLVELETETIPQKEEDESEKEVVDKVDTPALENEPHSEENVENMVQLETETLPKKEENIEKEVDSNVEIRESEASVDASKEIKCVEEQEKEDEIEKEYVDKQEESTVRDDNSSECETSVEVSQDTHVEAAPEIIEEVCINQVDTTA